MTKKIHVDKMSFRQLDFVFAKIYGLMIGDDGVVLKNKDGGLSVYHLSNFNPTKNKEMLNLVLVQKELIISPKKVNNKFTLEVDEKIITEESELVAIIKYCIFSKKEEIIEIPKNIN